MASPCFITWNAATTALTAVPTAVATVNGTKTMLQVKPNTSKLRIVEWGYSFDTAPASPLKVELLTTDVAATVTQGVVSPYNDSTGSATTVTLSAAGTGYTASAEGTIAATRLLGFQNDNAQYFKQQFPLGREPEVSTSQYLRVRVTNTTTTPNILIYIIWEE